MKDTTWLIIIIVVSGIAQKCVTMHNNDEKVIHLSNRQVYHEMTKQIDISCTFLNTFSNKRILRLRKLFQKTI